MHVVFRQASLCNYNIDIKFYTEIMQSVWHCASEDSSREIPVLWHARLGDREEKDNEY